MGKEGRYEHIKLEDKSKFDPKSFKTIDPGHPECTRVLIGCPKGHYEDGKCDVGMKAQSIILEKACFKRDLQKGISKYR